MICKPSKLGQTDLVIDLWSEFVSRSVRAGLQVSMCSGYSVSGKKETNVFLVMYSIKLGRFSWNLVYGFRNKFAAKSLTRFPPHLNNVSTLPCETWNAHHAGASAAVRKKLQNLPLPLNCDLKIRQIWIQLITVCWDYCNRRCAKHASLIWTNRSNDWDGAGQAGSCRHCGSYSPVASLIAPDQRCVFCTPSLAMFPT